MSFELISKKPRKGLLKVKGKEIVTPFFMPVATKATGKGVTSDDYTDLGNGLNSRSIISNSLLLHMKPGEALIEKLGGIHKFMNFNGVIFTDCGGFQVSSTFFENITKNSIVFKNPYTTGTVRLTPEKAMQIQHSIGSDVAMVLDEMAPYGASFEEAEKAMHKTHEWAVRSLNEHKRLESIKPTGQKVFAIVQGNFFPDLRKQSALFLREHDFDGFAIGGVAIGESQDEMLSAVKWALPHIPKDKPRYVMGVGKPDDVRKLIELGIDCFDSIYPAKNARHGSLFTQTGSIPIGKGRFSEDLTSIDENCNCKTCTNFTRAYIHHLDKIKEPSGNRLKTIHNLYFMESLVRK